MKIEFAKMEEKLLPNFKGGEKNLGMRMFDDGACKIMRGRLEPDTLRRRLALCAAHRPEQAAAFAALQTAAGQLQAENACCRVGQLAVNGRDLMALGAKPGPGLRGQLEALLEAVITGQLPNEREALLAAVKIELDP